MSESPKNTEEDTDISERSENLEDSEVVTVNLNDVLEFEDKLVENTAAVLGAASDKYCSYREGYLKRQPLYSCITCIPEAKEDQEKAGGICLACCYHCHDGHELIELYTKRNFRCDCGNSKFAKSENKCTLNDDKTDVNDLNTYNQNFSGTYCVCHRPYPDPEDPVPDEMIQCNICEDWYHSRHLGVKVPEENFAEMTCEHCIAKHEFLLHYDVLSTNREINIEDTQTDDSSKDVEKPSDVNSLGCKKPEKKSEKITARFWLELHWRKQLCTCDDCLNTYENEDVAFLLDPEDPVHVYEEKGKAQAKAVVEDQNKQIMNSVDRVQLLDAIAGYNEMKEHLAEYLKKFVENKKVVREEDIKEFFEGMKARKKSKTEGSY